MNSMTRSAPARAVWTLCAALNGALWKRLDFPNLLVGAVLGWLIGLPFYLKDRAEAAAVRATDFAGAEKQRVDDHRKNQLMLRAIEQVGGQATFVRDASGDIVDIRIDFAATARTVPSATATLSVVPSDR